MEKWKWLARGLDMEDDIVFEVVGESMEDSRQKAIVMLIERKIDWDVLTTYEEN